MLAILNEFTNIPEPKIDLKFQQDYLERILKAGIQLLKKTLEQPIALCLVKSILNDALFQTNVLSSWTRNVNNIDKAFPIGI